MTGSYATSHSLFLALAFSAVGGLLVLSVLMPSPARLLLWSRAPIAHLSVQMPESVPKHSSTELLELSDRPLFNVDRQRDPPVVIDGEEGALSGYRLVGIMAIGGSGIALIERKETGTTLTLKIGGVLDGKTVSEISSAGVKFTSPAGIEMLRVPKLSDTATATGMGTRPNPPGDWHGR